MYILLHLCGDPYKTPCPMVGDSKSPKGCLPLRVGTTQLSGKIHADAHGVHCFLGKLHRANVMPGRYRLNQNTFPPPLPAPQKSPLVLMAKSQLSALPSLSIVILSVQFKSLNRKSDSWLYRIQLHDCSVPQFPLLEMEKSSLSTRL